MQTKQITQTVSKAALVELRAAAIAAAKQAYCPYSRFPVGAAVFTSEGKIFSGCNVENASFGLTICAERNAIFHAVACGSKRILAVMLYTHTPNPTAPCGACRQVINEFGPNAEIYASCNGKRELHISMKTLLKYAFGPRDII